MNRKLAVVWAVARSFAAAILIVPAAQAQTAEGPFGLVFGGPASAVQLADPPWSTAELDAMAVGEICKRHIRDMSLANSPDGMGLVLFGMQEPEFGAELDKDLTLAQLDVSILYKMIKIGDGEEPICLAFFQDKLFYVHIAMAAVADMTEQIDERLSSKYEQVDYFAAKNADNAFYKRFVWIDKTNEVAVFKFQSEIGEGAVGLIKLAGDIANMYAGYTYIYASLKKEMLSFVSTARSKSSQSKKTDAQQF